MENSIRKAILFMSASTFWAILLSSIFTTTLVAENPASAQDLEEIEIKIEYDQAKLTTVFRDIEHKTQFSFLYDKEAIESIPSRITISKRTASIDWVLRHISRQAHLQFRQTNSTISVKKLNRNKEQRIIQTGTVTGKVIDASTGEPLPTANVYIEDTNKGTSTNAEGEYTLDDMEAGSYTLITSFIGYEQQEQPVTITADEVTTANFELEPAEGSLDEVVVVGYGSTTRRELTGSVEKVGASEIENQPVTNMLEALQGRMTGVSVTRESGRLGSGIQVRVRGINSIAAGRAPLYVIDGVPINSSSLGQNQTVNPLSSINPDNIESIEVLKDASATAIYGSRGSNGVVLITTKEAGGGETRLDVDYSTGISTATNIPDMLNTQQYLQIRQEAFDLAGETPGEDDPALTEWDQNTYTDWSEYAFGETGRRQNLQVRINGEEANTRYTLSGGYLNQQDLKKNGANQQRINAKAKLQQGFGNDRFQSSLTIDYTYTKLNSFTFAFDEIAIPPNYPVYDDNGDYYWVPDLQLQNPVARQEITSESSTHDIFGSADLRYEILDGLEVQTLISYNRQQLDDQVLTPTPAVDPFSSLGPGVNHSQFGSGTYQTFNFEPQLRYQTTLGDGQLKALLGGTWMHQQRETSNVEYQDFSSDALLRDWSAANTIGSRNSPSSEYKYLSAFGRLNYNWDDRYTVNATARRDGSSRFGPDKKWGNFGAVGVAWLFANESFVEAALPVLSYGKLRASYGVTGNDQIGNYGYLDTYSISEADLYDEMTILKPSNMGNPNYSWETTRKLEVALEVGLFNDRLRATVARYRNRSDNQLVQQEVPITTGFASYQTNLPALVENRGWEFDLRTENIRGRTFSWQTSFNLTLQQNELLEYPGLEDSPNADNYAIGQPLNRVRVYNLEGIDPTNGRAIYTDYNEDGNINTDDQVYLGPQSPRAFGGLSNSLRYKGFQLNIFAQFAQQLVTNWKSAFNSVVPGRLLNAPTNILGRYWQQPGDQAALPAVTIDPTGAWDQDWDRIANSNTAYEDIFYARLKTMSLSWSLPPKLSSKAGMRKARLYVRGQNLWTFTSSNLGKDPEVGLLTMPPPRTWTAGLQLSF